MSPRASAGQVGDDHFRSAVAAGKPGVVSSFLNDDTALRLERYPSRTEAQKAKAERQDAEDALQAARCTARYLMVRGHKCTGLRCRRKAHGDGLEAMREVLDMLGLREEAPRAKSAARRFER